MNPIANLTYKGPAATVSDFKFWNKVINRDNLYDNLISTTSAIYNFGNSEFLFGTVDGTCDESGLVLSYFRVFIKKIETFRVSLSRGQLQWKSGS